MWCNSREILQAAPTSSWWRVRVMRCTGRPCRCPASTPCWGHRRWWHVQRGRSYSWDSYRWPASSSSGLFSSLHPLQFISHFSYWYSKPAYFTNEAMAIHSLATFSFCIFILNMFDRSLGIRLMAKVSLLEFILSNVVNLMSCPNWRLLISLTN